MEGHSRPDVLWLAPKKKGVEGIDEGAAGGGELVR